MGNFGGDLGIYGGFAVIWGYMVGLRVSGGDLGAYGEFCG